MALHCTAPHRTAPRFSKRSCVCFARRPRPRAGSTRDLIQLLSNSCFLFDWLTPSKATLTSFFPAAGPASTQPDLKHVDAEERARTGAPSRSETFQIGEIYPGSLSAVPHISDFLLASPSTPRTPSIRKLAVKQPISQHSCIMCVCPTVRTSSRDAPPTRNV